jgi:hypothetical protein
MSNEEKQPPRKPDLYACPERDANRDYFNRLGAAWIREDGNIFVDMENQPRTGRYVLRKPTERIQEAKDNARDAREGERRDDKRSASREDRRDRNDAPRYER